MSKKKSFFREMAELALWFVLLLIIRSLLLETFVVPSESMLPTLQVGDTVIATKYDYGYSKYSFPLDMNITGNIMRKPAHRGDVAVFRYTQNTSISFVKRVIGLPGDKIQIKNGELFINDKKVASVLDQKYKIPYINRDDNGNALSAPMYGDANLYNETLIDGNNEIHHKIARLTKEGLSNIIISNAKVDPNNTSVYVVPPHYYFMMGDDRDNSGDSRFLFDNKGLGFVPQENLVGKVRFVLFSIQWTHPKFEFWYWPFEIRWNRFLHMID